MSDLPTLETKPDLVKLPPLPPAPPAVAQPPGPPAPLAPPAPSPGWGPRIAWALILLTVGFMLLATILPGIRGKAPPKEDPSDPQLALMVKYMVGVRSIMSYPPDILVSQIDAAAKSPMQKLHAAVFAGELQGPQIALERLDVLETDHPKLKADIDDFRKVYADGPDALDPESRDRLLDRHEFFARLALVEGKPPTDPMRQSVIRDGRFTAGAFLVFFLIAGVAAAAGFVLLVIAIVLYSTGSLRPAYKPQHASAPVCVEVFAVYLVSFVLLSFCLSLILRGSTSLGWSWLLTIVVPIAFAWGIRRGLSWAELRRAIGWYNGRGVLVELSLGVVGYVAGLPVVVLGFGITYVLILLSGTTPSHPVQGAQTDSLISILLLYSIACIWAPVIEETMFRGALYSHLRSRLGWVSSGLIVGVIFAAIHPQGWTVIPALASIGFVLAMIREWRGTILASIAAHALSNFAVISLLVAVK